MSRAGRFAGACSGCRESTWHAHCIHACHTMWVTWHVTHIVSHAMHAKVPQELARPEICGKSRVIMHAQSQTFALEHGKTTSQREANVSQVQ
jgi:hypothetical protein